MWPRSTPREKSRLTRIGERESRAVSPLATVPMRSKSRFPSGVAMVLSAPANILWAEDLCQNEPESTMNGCSCPLRFRVSHRTQCVGRSGQHSRRGQCLAAARQNRTGLGCTFSPILPEDRGERDALLSRQASERINLCSRTRMTQKLRIEGVKTYVSR